MKVELNPLLVNLSSGAPGTEEEKLYFTIQRYFADDDTAELVTVVRSLAKMEQIVIVLHSQEKFWKDFSRTVEPYGVIDDWLELAIKCLKSAHKELEVTPFPDKDQYPIYTVNYRASRTAKLPYPQIQAAGKLLDQMVARALSIMPESLQENWRSDCIHALALALDQTFDGHGYH